jgi:uncharacterized membrane protein
MQSTAGTPDLTKDIAGLAGLFLTSGAVHLLRPQVYEGIVPRMLPNRRALVYASGVAELACAAGLLYPPTRKVAGLASAALLVAVFPANVQMSADYGKRAQSTQDTTTQAKFVGTLARLPLQWPMIRTALRAAGRM